MIDLAGRKWRHTHRSVGLWGSRGQSPLWRPLRESAERFHVRMGSNSLPLAALERDFEPIFDSVSRENALMAPASGGVARGSERRLGWSLPAKRISAGMIARSGRIMSAHSKENASRCVPAPHPQTQGSARGTLPVALCLLLNAGACRARGRDRYRRRKAGVKSNYVGKVLNWLFETVQSLFPQGALMSGFRPQFR